MVTNIAEAARVIEKLTGVPSTIRGKMTRKERQEQAARVKRFLTASATSGGDSPLW